MFKVLKTKFQVLLQILKHPGILVILIYFISVILVNPVGEFPINDDWVYFFQVRDFLTGDFRIAAFIDASFILQGLLGYVWSSIVGLSLFNLRLLTVLFILPLVLGILFILGELDVKKELLFMVLIFVFNPLVYSSSLTFMTEIYFLTFTIWSIGFFLRYLRKRTVSSFYIGMILASLSILLRQTGLVVIIAFYSVLALIILRSDTPLKEKFKGFLRMGLPGLFIVILSLIIIYFWPKYALRQEFSTLFIEPKYFLERLNSLPLLIPIFIFSLLPILSFKFYSFKPVYRVIVLTLGFIFLNTIYKHNVFPLGNIFYIEGLYLKSWYKSNLNLFDNPVTKLFVSYLISVGSLVFLYTIYEKIKKINLEYDNLFLFVTGLGFFLLFVITNDFYDRYAIPLILIAVLLYAKNLSIEKGNKTCSYHKTLSYSLLFILIFISVSHNYEFFKSTNLKWYQAAEIRKMKNINTGIYLNDTYTKYVYALKVPNYRTGNRNLPGGLIYKCYISSYTLGSDLLIFKTLDFPNPKIYGRTLKPQKNIKKHLNELIFNQEYFSPAYSIIGKRAYVGSWCDNE